MLWNSAGGGGGWWRWTTGCWEPGICWGIAHVAQALWPESHHQGITALFLLLPFLSKERNSYIKTFPGSRHLPALTHQEIASPLCLPTFLPEHSPAQGVASPPKICWCWLTSKQKLPPDKKSHSTIGNLFVLGGAFFLSLLSRLQPLPPPPPPPKSTLLTM